MSQHFAYELSPLLTTPALAQAEIPSSSIQSSVKTLPDDNHLSAYLDTDTLTSADIKSDPILASLAKKQNIATPSTSDAVLGFKARPAPAATRTEDVGPRMNKSSALRMGLKWDDGRGAKDDVKLGRDNGLGKDNISGYKRTGFHHVSRRLQSLNIADKYHRISLH
jgi:hypothetical protein